MGSRAWPRPGSTVNVALKAEMGVVGISCGPPRRLRPEAEAKAQVGLGHVVGPVGQGRWIDGATDVVVEYAAGRHDSRVGRGCLGGRLSLDPHDRGDGVRPGFEVGL